MPDVIVADTSCFIVLSKIGELELLQKMYNLVTITPDVASEYGQPLPLWIRVATPSSTFQQQTLELHIDRGEASVVALALELAECVVIVDDHKARRVAHQLGLKTTGTLGVIAKAKQRGVVLSVKPLLEKIRQTDFRLTDKLEQHVLRQAGES